MTLLLGLDIGTTSVKAGIFDVEGHCLSIARQDYELQTPTVDHVELNAETYWSAACKAIKQALASDNVVVQEIGGIGVSSQGETVIPVNIDGNPIHPALVWLDNRAHIESDQLTKQLASAAYRHTGIPDINPTWTACKIAWLRDNRPQVFQAAHKFLLVQDFIIHRLTAQFVTDGAIACTTLLYDIVENQWWPQALQAVGLDPERLPAISKPGSVAGVLTRQAAEATGLLPEIPVVLGGMDQAAGAVGAGNIQSEMISETTGGALTIQVTVPRPDIDPSGRVPVYVHSIPDHYLFVPVCDTGGMALQWFRDNFAESERLQAVEEGIDVYDLLTRLASEVPPGCDGLLMLPHLTGAFSPEYNPHARGVFYGFTLFHKKAHFTRAVLEAVAYMLRRNLELIAQTGIKAEEMRSTGGGAASQLWRQIKADVCQLPVVTLRNSDTAPLGDAMLAAVAINLFPSLDKAVSAMVSTAERLDPIPGNAALYDLNYQRYCELNDVLEPLFRQHFELTTAE
ncbi:MAG: xylulokinase [Anaerolineales bacterium]